MIIMGNSMKTGLNHQTRFKGKIFKPFFKFICFKEDHKTFTFLSVRYGVQDVNGFKIEQQASETSHIEMRDGKIIIRAKLGLVAHDSVIGPYE